MDLKRWGGILRDLAESQIEQHPRATLVLLGVVFAFGIVGWCL